MRTPVRWSLGSVDEVAVTALAGQLGLVPALATVLVRRGITDFEAARTYFRPAWDQLSDPHLMLGMDVAVQRIALAVAQREPVLVYGDYDVDGTTSVALICHYLRHIGHPFHYYVPDRSTEGYGLSLQGVDAACAHGCKLVLVFDCGTRDLEATAYAAQLGLDLIIADHHQPGPTLPTCTALLNPLQPGCGYPFQSLSGCGIAFQLLRAVDAHLALGTDLSLWAELPALSTACDLVPLLRENRVLATLGQQKLQTNPLPGIKALMDRSDRTRTWNTEDLLFFLGPRINAAGRLHHAKYAVALMLGEADAIEQLAVDAANLDQHNTERRAIEAETVQEALNLLASDDALAAKHSIVLHHAGWHKGVVGIVASKLVERYYRPTVLLAPSDDGCWVGSCRSVAGFDVHAALVACREHLQRFGGHQYAAGVRLTTEQVPLFRAAFEAYCAAHLTLAQRAPVLDLDAEVPLAAITPKFVRILRQMAPFGPGNPHPYFLARDVQVVQWRILKEQHLKLTVRQGDVELDAIGFHLAEHIPPLERGDRLAIVFDPQFNNWNGQQRIQLVLKDVQVEPASIDLHMLDAHPTAPPAAAHVPVLNPVP